ncbi:MAG: cytochrome c3 family protein [Capsulimonadales bacterium]|nr:cytochrome c3 family protein [Capsulimonadales bacterium]
MAQIFRPYGNVIARLVLILLALTPLTLMVTMSQFTRSSYVTKVGVPYEQPVPFSHEHHVNELGIDCRYCHSSVEVSGSAGYPSTHTCMSCHSQIWTNSPLLEPVRESYIKNVPLKWTRLNELPDFVYFNHSIHVNRGISCNNCHGPVQAMQMAYKGQAFQMRWCLECHRNPERYVNETQFVWDLYRNIQRGQRADGTVLTNEEEALKRGLQYHRNEEELKKGRELVKKYNIQTQALSDCSICHR